MKDIAVQSNLSPASFEGKKPLTSGQKRIIKLLTDKISAAEMIAKSDIIDLYWGTVCDKKGEVWRERRRWEGKFSEGKYVYYMKQFFKHDIEIIQGAMTWFKSNLGICILKGKLLAIPVIDI